MIVGASGFEFENTQYVLLISLVFPLLFALYYTVKKFSEEKDMLGSSLLSFNSFSRYIRRFFPLLILVLVWLALLGPRGNPRYSEEEVKDREASMQMTPSRGNVVIVLDTSASMTAIDTSSNESRFNAAKEFIDELVQSNLQANFTLYAMGSEMVKIVPRTLDKVFLRLLLKQTSINEGGAGTTFISAFNHLAQDLATIPDPVALVILSDGEDTSLEGVSPNIKKEAYEEILKLIISVPPRSIPIYGIAFGTKEGGLVPGISYQGQGVISRRNEDLLSFLSKATGGKTWNFNDFNTSNLVEDLVTSLSQPDALSTEKQLTNPRDSLIWDYYFQVPLFFALLAFLAYSLLPKTTSTKSRGFFVLFLMLNFTAYSEDLGRRMNILLEAGNEPAVEELLQSTATEDPWQKGAILFNQAAIKVEEGDPVKAREVLDQLSLSSDSSSFVKEKLAELRGLISLRISEEMKDDEEKFLNLISSLVLMNETDKAACQLQHEKGYETCTPTFNAGEIKKRAKKDFESRNEEDKESSPQNLLAFTLQWIERVKLTLEHPSYYEAFVKSLNERPTQRLKSALNNYMQKDFSESLELLEKESRQLMEEVKKTVLLDRLEIILKKKILNPYDIYALLDEKSEAAVQKLLEGKRIWARLLLLVRLQEVKRELYHNLTPLEVLKNTVDEMRVAIIIQVFAKEIQGFNQWNLVEAGQQTSLENLALFNSVSQKWREVQFFKSGCETVPWPQIMPLVEKGSGSGFNAFDLLKAQKFPLALQEQSSSINFLREAIKLLENPPPPSQTPDSKETLSETVRVFQDLEISDRALQSKPPVSKPVEKPW